MDFSIDELFRVSGSIKIGKTTLWLRTLGAIEDNEREHWCNAEGVKTLRALRDPDSILYQSYIAALDLADKVQLVSVIQSSRALEMWQQADEMIYARGETEPTLHATIAEVVSVAEENDTAQQEIEKARFETYLALMAAVKEDTEKLDGSTLHQQAIRAQEGQILQSQRIQDWRLYTLYAALYKDSEFKERYFKSPAVVATVNPTMRERLLKKYEEVDTFSKDGADALAFLDE